VAVQKIGSVIELPGFCRVSPAWTDLVENPCPADFAPSLLGFCVFMIFFWGYRAIKKPRRARYRAVAAGLYVDFYRSSQH
jgi:hypothetical protein